MPLSNDTIRKAVRMAQYAKPEQALKILENALGTTAEETEIIQDIVGAMFGGNTETLISAVYQDGDGTIDLVVDDDLSLYDNSISGFISGITSESIFDLLDVNDDPDADAIPFWDDSDGALEWITFMPDGFISESSVTQHSAALAITESQISDLGNYIPLAQAATLIELGL